MQQEQEQKISRTTWIEFFVLSLVSLYIELLFIRWLAADIRAFSVFKTFPLVACFIGLGVGYAAAKDKLFRLSLWALLVSVVILKLADVLGVGNMPFPSLSVYYWHDMRGTTDIWFRVGVMMLVILYVLMGPFALMACLGARLGALFNRLPVLPAYCVNIGASIIGSVIFTLLSFQGFAPWLLLCGPALVLLFYCRPQSRRDWLLQLLPTAGSILIAAHTIPLAPGAVTNWSPYQRLDIVPAIIIDKSTSSPVTLAYQLCANRIGYQVTFDWQKISQFSSQLPKEFLKEVEAYRRRYTFPFELRQSQDVLVLGAGMGEDVNAALNHGAKSVDAVDIDPFIIKLGRQLNSQHPYETQNVTAICNDARNFLRNCHKKYDLIVFSHVDSHVTTAGSSVRTDNYLYTRESLAQALTLLKPDGLVVLSYRSDKNWLSDRLLNTTSQAIGYMPLQLNDKEDPGNVFYIFGKPVEEKSFKLPEEILEDYQVASNKNPQPSRILTDDWPYLYVTPGIIDFPYMLVVIELLAFALIAVRRSLGSIAAEPGGLQMFFLGAGFLLLELQAISRLSLLYGSTWLTSAIVINGVLIMILLANLLVIKTRQTLLKYQQALYAALIASLMASYFLPYQHMLSDSNIDPWLVAAAVTVCTLIPVLISAMIFSVAFSQSKRASSALAMNLFGSFCGAMLEYLANYFGHNSLVLIALFLYAASWIFMPKAKLASAAV